MKQSTAEGVNLMPTRLIKQVTMLIYMALEAASWNSWVENIVDTAICIRSYSLANSGGMPVTTHGWVIPMQSVI